MILEALGNLFERSPLALDVFIMLDGIELLVQYQKSNFAEVFKLVSDLLERFFHLEEMTEEEKTKFMSESPSYEFMV